MILPLISSGILMCIAVVRLVTPNRYPAPAIAIPVSAIHPPVANPSITSPALTRARPPVATRMWPHLVRRRVTTSVPTTAPVPKAEMRMPTRASGLEKVASESPSDRAGLRVIMGSAPNPRAVSPTSNIARTGSVRRRRNPTQTEVRGAIATGRGRIISRPVTSAA
jgi:hypothetical protein